MMALAVVVAMEAAAMVVEMGVGTEGPNQATTATMGAARRALVAAARGVPEELAPGDQEAGGLGVQAALEEQGRGVLGQMRATTHDLPFNGARSTRCNWCRHCLFSARVRNAQVLATR